mmetsp:Transcript_4960/g.7214  ORF Transcript_4960/g.7214 Transcript_4960/m.7214 type:complete len:201 (+) Transcript_4960:587-1189(+)
MRSLLKLPVRLPLSNKRIPSTDMRRTSPSYSVPWELTWKPLVSSVPISKNPVPCNVPPSSLTWPTTLPLNVLLPHVWLSPPQSTLPTSVTCTSLSSLLICLLMPMLCVRFPPPVRKFQDVVVTQVTCIPIFPPFTSVPDVLLEETDPLPSFLFLPCLTTILLTLFLILPDILPRDKSTLIVSCTPRESSLLSTCCHLFLV